MTEPADDHKPIRPVNGGDDAVPDGASKAAHSQSFLLSLDEMAAKRAEQARKSWRRRARRAWIRTVSTGAAA